MPEFKLLFDEIVYHVQNIDTLTKPTMKEALKVLLDTDAHMISLKETYQLGFNPVRLVRNGDLLLGFRLLGDEAETITVSVGGTEYDLELQPNKFEFALLTDILPIVALTFHDVHLQLKERHKTVYIECISALLNSNYRSTVAKTDWRLERNIEVNRHFAVCTSGLFGIVNHDLTVQKKACKDFKNLKHMTWDELHSPPSMSLLMKNIFCPQKT